MVVENRSDNRKFKIIDGMGILEDEIVTAEGLINVAKKVREEFYLEALDCEVLKGDTPYPEISNLNIAIDLLELDEYEIKRVWVFDWDWT